MQDGQSAGFAQALDKALGPQSKANEHKKSQDMWSQMRSKFTALARNVPTHYSDPKAAAEGLDALRAERDGLYGPSAALEDWTKPLVKEEFKRK